MRQLHRIQQHRRVVIKALNHPDTTEADAEILVDLLNWLDDIHDRLAEMLPDLSRSRKPQVH